MKTIIPDANLQHAVLGIAFATITLVLPINGVAGLGPMLFAWAYALNLSGFSWEVSMAAGIVVQLLWVASCGLNAAVVSMFRSPTLPKAK